VDGSRARRGADLRPVESKTTREAYEMNGMDFEGRLIRQRNAELLREVRTSRLEERLRASRGRRGGVLSTAVAAIRRLQPAI
jgi:hypothetical protein